MSVLSAGANAPLTGSGPYKVVVTHAAGPSLDLTAFLMNADQRVRSDEDMVFYNQNLRASQGAEWCQPVQQGSTVTHTLVVDPAKWPADITRVRVALTADGVTFGAVQDLQAFVLDSSGAEVTRFDLAKRSVENAFIVAEVYKHNGALKARCVAAGFTDGLAGLARDVGVSVDDEPEAAASQPVAPPPAPQAPPAINLVKQLAETPPPANASAVDLRKHKLAVVLVKNKLDGKKFRVVLAIDASGSMGHLFADRGGYSTGGGGFFGRRNAVHVGGQPSVVQCSLERMVPIADLLDDNHDMEVIYFGSVPSWSESVTVQTMEGYVNRTRKQKEKAGWSNVEPLMMQEVINWVNQNPSPYPTVVLAWSDGGVGNEAAIKRLLVESSKLPIFWMWLGLGRADYGVLSRLDKVEGGVVDNAGFIEIDNIEEMSDDVLYAAIFKEVSKWFRDAIAAGVIAA